MHAHTYEEEDEDADVMGGAVEHCFFPPLVKKDVYDTLALYISFCFELFLRCMARRGE